MKLLILWDQFGEAPMEAYLIEPKNDGQRAALLSLHGAFVNSTNTADDHPVYKFSELLYSKKKPLERFKVDWPIRLTEPVTVVHCGFFP